MTADLIIRGETLAFRVDPFARDPGADTSTALAHDTDGAIVVSDGRIQAIGTAGDILAAHPRLPVEHWRGHLIMSGFVDAHAHYPQTEIIASYGAQLIEWLNKYTFPAELKFADPTYARGAAEIYLDECLKNGTTSASVYATVHAGSADALFEAAAARNIAIATGKVMMDRNAPAGLTDTPKSGYDDSKRLIAKWHGKGRATYVITPRFAPTSTPEQLEAAGALWREHPDALMQTHISENRKEIAWVKELFPAARDYLDVYERAGLIGPGSNFGHAIHLGGREIARLRETGSGISHCPTSNLFIGSGLFDVKKLRDTRKKPVTVGLATDVGGGSSFSMFATMRAAYKIAQLKGYSLHPAKAYYLATMGSAALLRMSDRIGNLEPGKFADIIVIDPRSTPLIDQRVRRANEISDVLFAQMILADDRAIAATYIAGQRLHTRAGAGPA